MQHVIIGTGPAGVVAAETLRSLDPNATITMIGNEPEPPYSRMAIPYLLVGNIEEEGTYLRKTEDYFGSKNIDVVQDHVAKVDAINKTLELKSGGSLNYDRLLIATGSHPIRPPVPGLDNPAIRNCWTLEDARGIEADLHKVHMKHQDHSPVDEVQEEEKPGFFARLFGGGKKAESAPAVKPEVDEDPRPHVVLIGAGFIGCIVLESLVRRNANLTVIEQGDRMVPRMLDYHCGNLLKKWCEDKGVTVLTSTRVSKVAEQTDGTFTLELDGDHELEDADAIICATGVAPNIDFLKGTGVKVADGILVDEFLQTNVPDIYAAGDVAESHDFAVGGTSVHAIQPVAAEHARIAATNMVQSNSSPHQGSLVMNVLDTLGLISASYGAWHGVEGGESSELYDPDDYRYIRLQFDGDILVGANTLGMTQHVGALRGLIQSRLKLGPWKEKLMDNPLHFAEAYVALSQGHS